MKRRIITAALLVALLTICLAVPVFAGGKGAIRGTCYDDNATWLGEITYLANKSGGHLWFTPTLTKGPYIAGHSYHNVYKLNPGDLSEWAVVPSVPDRQPYNIIAIPGEPVYYKIFDTTTDIQVVP